jgi:FixJ family two-component response regulator/flagellar biosynthesis/type III secretory pathway protein FliH
MERASNGPATVSRSQVGPIGQRESAILVVDDEEAIRELLVRILKSMGHRVRAVGSAREAHAALKESPVSLLITDVKLPDQDGIALLQQACELDHRMMGLVMTGYGTVDLAVQAMKAGAAEFLMKPFENEALQLTVNRLLDLYHLRSENTILKQAVVRAARVRCRSLALTDFDTGHRFVGDQSLSDYEQGFAEGERRAAACVAEARQQEQQLLAEAVRRFDDRWTSLHKTVEEDVTALAFSLATRILRDTMIERRDAILGLLKSALATVREAGLVTVRTHPSDTPILDSARAELCRDRPTSFALHVEGDPSLARGSCVVQSMNRLVDASLSQQLLRLGEAIQRRGRRESPRPD